MTTRYFVTGTGTGVGKTFVTCSLATLARSRGLDVVAHKPIETGCLSIDGRLVGDDQARLCEASSAWLRTSGDDEVAFGTYQFQHPLAPSAAAAREGRTIDMARIQGAIERAIWAPKGTADLLLVEGAGGWRVPITPQHDMSSLARMVGGQVLVVGLATLGTINHSLLTLEAVERDGLSVAALVLSNRPEDSRSTVEGNVEQIRARWSGRVLLIGELDQLLPS